MMNRINKVFPQYTYGGLDSNPLSDSCFYCYLIYDKIYDTYYSGVKTERKSNVHSLMKTYFTTSSIIDFKDRLIEHPNDFEYILEFFRDKESAFDLKAGVDVDVTPAVLKSTPHYVAKKTPKVYAIDNIIFIYYRDFKKYMKHTYNLPVQVNDNFEKYKPYMEKYGAYYIFKKDYYKKYNMEFWNENKKN